jgi:hypothetical protein
MKFFYVFLVLVLCLSTNIYSQVLLEENFDYTQGDLITDHGWVAHSDSGIFPIKVSSSGLSFANHPGSGIGNAALLGWGDGEDDHKLFTPVTSGAVYTSFMVAQYDLNADGYFFSYSSNPHSPDERATVWLRTLASGTENSAKFGLSFGDGLPLSTDFNYNIGETYLFVVKYEIIDGDNNDEVSLYIFNESSPPTSTEPAIPNVGPRLAGGETEINPGSINLRQPLATKNMEVDGIIVSTTWSGVVTDVISAEPIHPVEFNLSQNYPNPFNPETNIKYQLTKSSQVRLTIYNQLGQEVATLVNELQNAGVKSVVWNGKNSFGKQVSSGVYYFRIVAGDFVQSRKMMLLK